MKKRKNAVRKMPAKNALKKEKVQSSLPELPLSAIAGILLIAIVVLYGAWQYSQHPATTSTTTSTTLNLGNVNGSELSRVDANYSVTPSEICKTPEGKPLAFYFGKSDCEYCDWEKPLFESAMAEFNGAIDSRVYNIDVDLGKMSDGEKALFVYYQRIVDSPQVPVVVLGCKFHRYGVNNKLQGEEGELAALKKLSCNLFAQGEKPANC